MKLIKNIIFSIVLFSIILIVYFNMDSIVEYSKQFFVGENVIEIQEPNKYKRHYIYEKYTNYSRPEEYIPSNKEDLEEIIYNVLNNGWNTFTFYCPDEYTTCTTDMETLSDNKEKLSSISNYVSPFNSYRNLKTKIYVDGKIELEIEKNYSDEDISLVNAKMDELETKLKLKTLTRKEAITKVHDYILTHSKYDKVRSEQGTSNYSSNKANGALLEGMAICSGYSDAMALYLDRFSIPNIKVASEKHVWNLVYLDNKWINIDLTWDLPLKDGDKISNAFMLITKEQLAKLDTTEHTLDLEIYPEAK